MMEQVSLNGPHVRLEPLRTDHRQALITCLQDGELWSNPFTFVPHPDQLDDFFLAAQRGVDEGRELPFAIVDVATELLVGSTRYRSMEEDHRRTEIGFTFVASSWQRTHVNTEAKFLLLRHAFEVLGYRRVEFVTDARNEQSRAAIRRLGAEEEGLLRHHMVLRDGRSRDSVIFSIIASEWPGVRERLHGLLRGREPRDET